MYAYGCSGDKVLMVSTLMEAPEVRLDYACAGAEHMFPGTPPLTFLYTLCMAKGTQSATAARGDGHSLPSAPMNM
jgi:hypothetical protein